MAKYRKAIVAVATVVGVAIAQFLGPDAHEQVLVLANAIVGALGVYAVRNEPAV